MTSVLSGPVVLTLLNSYRVQNYFIAASCAAVTYDWVLTFGQEIELVWRRRWSLMTFLYMFLRYAGLPYALLPILINHPSLSETDAGCISMFKAMSWATFVVNVMLGIIMITRLHAMYQRSRKILIFLVVIFVAVMIMCGIITLVVNTQVSGGLLVVPSARVCFYLFGRRTEPLDITIWIAYIMWDGLVLSLAVWVVVKHFREQRQTATGWNTGDCFAMLLRTHVAYFASLVVAYCFQLGFYSPDIMGSFSVEAGTYDGILALTTVMQLFVLGPRLILSIREYHAKLVADSDAATAMTTIAFQERAYMSTGSGV